MLFFCKRREGPGRYVFLWSNPTHVACDSASHFPAKARVSGRREWIGVGLVGHVTTSQRQVLPSSYVVDAQLMQSARAGLSLTSVDFFLSCTCPFHHRGFGLGQSLAILLFSDREKEDDASGVNDPGRTRTCNPRLRRPMPYPLGHGASCQIIANCS